MKLTTEQILEIIKKPKNRDAVTLAIAHEDRLKMHCEPILESMNASPAVINFLGWVKSFLPSDKYEKFSKLLTFPIETVDSTKKIFDELSKIFNAPDQSIGSDFTVPDYAADYSTYLSNLRNDEYWETTGFEALKSGINSFLIVDLPTTQRSFLPEPYYYLLDIRSVFDVEVNDITRKVEYIIFWQKDGTLMCFEETCFRRFKRQEQGGEWVQIYQQVHSTWETFVDENQKIIGYGKLIDGLGFTPAAPFWRPAIAGSKNINKRSPITRSLTKLDWLLFHKTSQKYFQLYASYPIIVTYESECEYKDTDGNKCEEGYINYMFVDPVDPDKNCQRQKRCPVCENRGVIGAGSFWTVDPPRDKDEADLMENPVKIVEVGVDLLDFGVKEMERLEDEIFLNCAGFVQEVTTEAANEKDVESRFETRKAILDDIRKEFEAVQLFATDTMARLRYGRYYLQTTVHYGKEYFLQTASDIAKQYKEAKVNGLPAYEVARIRNNYSQTRFKNDEQQYRRQYILSLLEPYPDYTAAELKTFGMDTADPVLFELKLDFANFVAKFEREQMNVVEFGSLIAFDEKINIIQTKLQDYAKKRTSGRPQPDSKAVAGSAV